MVRSESLLPNIMGIRALYWCENGAFATAADPYLNDTRCTPWMPVASQKQVTETYRN